MAKSVKPLTVIEVRNATKPGRYADGNGLYLNVKSTGAKSWIFLWMKSGRRREMGLGSFPDVTLSAARDKARDSRAIVAAGGDPIEAKNTKAVEVELITFRYCADEYIKSIKAGFKNAKHIAQWEMTLGPSYCKSIESKSVDEVTTNDMLEILAPIWMTKAETASRIRGRLERVLDFAQVKGWRSGENPARWRGHLKNALPARRKLQRGHHPAMPYKEIAPFLKLLHDQPSASALGLEFLILTACRSGEVIGARFSEFDFKEKVWTIPADRMKAGVEHRVPLSDRALKIVEELAEVRLHDYVFAGAKPLKPLSGMAFTMFLRRQDKGHFTPHGFRSSFRDWAGDETRFQREVIEQALAHTIGNETERAYRRSDALARRRLLMNAWAAYCGVPNPSQANVRQLRKVA